MGANRVYDSVKRISDFIRTESGAVFTCQTEMGRNMDVAIDFVLDDVLRVRAGAGYATSGIRHSLLDSSFIPRNSGISFEYNENHIILKSNALVVKINMLQWQMIVQDKDGNLILKDVTDDVDAIGKLRAMPLGFELNAEGDIEAVNQSFGIKFDEHFYGFGEKFNEFDKRGQKLVMYNRDALGVKNEWAYKNVPFFISTSGYGFFVNSTRKVEFDMGYTSNAAYTVRVPDQALEYYIIFGPDFKRILYNYRQMTGAAPMPPLWSFGLWISTGFQNATERSVEDTARKMRKKGIPCDVIHFDCYWLNDNMWCDFEWDSMKFPEPEVMIKELKDQGFKICLWINPYVSERSDMFKEGVAGGYFLKRANGDVYVKDMWHGLQPPCGIIDITNPYALEWLKAKLKRLLHMGVDVFKTDFGEDIPDDAYFYNGSTGADMHNLYSVLYNKVVFETTMEVKGKDTLVWGRSGYAGSQKYPACWSGDPACSFEAMAAVLRGGLSYGLSGVPFWSHDIGGFYGTPSPKLYIRWAQFGLMCSHSRCHGTTSRDPWLFGGEAERIFTQYVRLRYKLLPYIYSTALCSCTTGLPFIRALLIEHPDDPTVYHIDDQYYFGESIMVAPVFSEEDRRKVYLPKGEWVDFWTRSVYAGPTWIDYCAPIDVLPIFVKRGAIIPVLGKEIQYIDSNVFKDNVIFEVYDDKYTKDIIYTEHGKAYVEAEPMSYIKLNGWEDIGRFSVKFML